MRNNLYAASRGSLLMRGGEICVRNNFYMAGRQVLIRFWNNFSQSASRFFFTERIRNHPDTELIVFQSRLEVWNQYVEQVFFGLVEVAKVRTPRDITDDADSRPP